MIEFKIKGKKMILKFKPYPGYWFLLSHKRGGDIFRSTEGANFNISIEELGNFIDNN